MGYFEKIVPDMWADFKDDSVADLEKTFMNDMNSDQFDIDKIIKDSDDRDACITFLQQNMTNIMMF